MLSLLTRTCVTVALSWAGLGVTSSLGAPTGGGLGPIAALDPTLQLPLESAALELSDEALAQKARTDPTSLGSLSLGEPHRGRLLGGVAIQSSPLFEVVVPEFAYGTHETVAYLERAVRKVHARFPGTLPLHVGHLSRPSGGYVSPHKSHQSGRDVDLGFFYKKDRAWYRRGTAQNLDLERNWALLRSLITETDVEMIIVDASIQRLLRDYALKIGENPVWLRQIFSGDAKRPKIIRHLWGHTTHFHVRFYSPAAQVLAARAYPHLLETQLVEPIPGPSTLMSYRAKKGDTLGKLAARFGTTVRAIQNANGMRGNVIQAKHVYKIPRSGAAALSSPPARSLSNSPPAAGLPPPTTGLPPRTLAIPPRRLPPAPS